MRRSIWIIMAISVIGLAACAAAPAQPQQAATDVPPSTTPTVTPIPPTSTHDAAATVPANVRPTLPPTFTPTFTPSITPIPSVTPTPTITSTPTPIDERFLCESFRFGLPEEDGSTYFDGQRLVFAGRLAYRNMFIEFEAISEETGQVLAFQQAGGDWPLGALIEVEQMPVAGRWDWMVAVNDLQRSGLCARGGHFFIERDAPDDTPGASIIATVTAQAASNRDAAETTPEATSDVTEAPESDD